MELQHRPVFFVVFTRFGPEITGYVFINYTIHLLNRCKADGFATHQPALFIAITRKLIQDTKIPKHIFLW